METEDADDEESGGKMVLVRRGGEEREECEDDDDDDDDDEVEGALDGIGWWDRDTCHRLSTKSCDKILILPMLKLAFALIRATWTKDEKQFRMLLVWQKMVLGRVTGVFLLWLNEVMDGALFCEFSLGGLDVDRFCNSARV